MSITPDQVVLAALEEFVDACASDGHAQCGGGVQAGASVACWSALQAHVERQRLKHLAHSFDARQQLLEQGAGSPSDFWSTAALLRLVRDEVCTAPWSRQNPFRSGLRATSALARLGERGLPADALVRTGLRNELRRAITSATVQVVCAVQRHAQSQPPPTARAWMDVLGDCPDQRSLGTAGASQVFLLASTAFAGDFKDVVDAWLSTASMKDVVGWGRPATPAPLLDEDDLALRGGDEAVQWICERFSATRLGDWSRCSLEWELRYTADPVLASGDAGVAKTLLEGRVVVRDELVAELALRLARPAARDPLFGGLTRSELQDQVLVLLHGDGADAAAAMLREAVHQRPADVQLRNMLAFCLVATEPLEALLHLEQITAGTGGMSRELLIANRASAALRCQDVATAHELLVDLRDGTSEETYLLWDPTSLVDASVELRAVKEATAPEWARSVLRAGSAWPQ